MVFNIYRNERLVGEFFFKDKETVIEYMTILKEDSYSTWIAKRIK